MFEGRFQSSTLTLVPVRARVVTADLAGSRRGVARCAAEDPPLPTTIPSVSFVALAGLAVGMSACARDPAGGAGEITSGSDATAEPPGDSSATDSGPSPETADETAVPNDSAGDSAGDTDTATEPETSACGSPRACALAAEERSVARLAAVAQDDPLLWAFVREMPKGGDLHHHLSGGVYAETYLEWASDAGNYCITTATLSLASSCNGSGKVQIPASDEPLYGAIVAAWSMEGFDPDGPESGHDHFFATFGKFGAISGTHHGLMLADVRTRAAGENEHYLELMLTSNSAAQGLGEDHWSGTLSKADLPGFYATLMAAPGLDAAIRRITDDVTESEAEADAVLGCGTPNARAGCEVTALYQVYISRSGSPPGVFAQMVAAYEAGIRDARVVGLNLVGPEDSATSLSRYDIEMEMLGFLHETYRVTGKSPVRLALHAGELTPEYTPDSTQLDEANHIRKAVEIARADRIGHGVDVLLEANPSGLLADLDTRDVLVEICLSSNIQILELSGDDHPLGAYLDAGVPLALATDDQGVSRSSIAVEFRRAVMDQGLGYRQLKQMARASLEHSFAPGDGIWQSLAEASPVAACAPGDATYLGAAPAPTACQALLDQSLKARLQWELERRFHVFEAQY